MMRREHKIIGKESWAEFSDCEKYRYSLQREWGSFYNKLLVFIMLNPSTADETKNDPTVERCERRALAGSYYGFRILNLFAFRATEPSEMKKAADPVGGYQNTIVLQNVLSMSQNGRADIICGWGTHGSFLERDKEVLSWFDHYSVKPLALKVTKDGFPGHPLYIRSECKPIPLPKKYG